MEHKEEAHPITTLSKIALGCFVFGKINSIPTVILAVMGSSWTWAAFAVYVSFVSASFVLALVDMRSQPEPNLVMG